MRKQAVRPERRMVEFFGYTEREVDLFCLLTERYDIGLADLFEMVVKEVTVKMSESEDARDGLLELLKGKSRDGLQLRMDTPLLTALDAAKRDQFHCTDRMNSLLNPPGVEELLKLMRRSINWNWFFACRCPDAARRQSFADTAAMGEAALERLAARAQRILDARLLR